MPSSFLVSVVSWSHDCRREALFVTGHVTRIDVTGSNDPEKMTEVRGEEAACLLIFPRSLVVFRPG